MIGSTGCAICDGSTERFGTARVLDRFEAQYERCQGCGAIRAVGREWLPDAYERSITDSDIGLVSRNIQISRQVGALSQTILRDCETWFDYGSGTGILVRLLRDAGLDAYYHDRFGPNLFARGFEKDPSAFERIGCSMAVEVLEHLVDPHAELGDVLARSEWFLATTVVLPDPAPPLDDWWYYGLEHGQHVLFWTPSALEKFGAAHGFSVTSYAGLHLFSRRPRSARALRIALNPLMVGWRKYRPRVRRESLLGTDFEAARRLSSSAVVGAPGPNSPCQRS